MRVLPVKQAVIEAMLRSQQNALLKWTPEMQAVKEKVKRSPDNHEVWTRDPQPCRVAEHDGYAFFLFVPGGSCKGNAWEAIREGDIAVQRKLPRGYRLVAWYGWGSQGWLAQTKEERIT